jgi:glycosyltransferase involved in cell wall biosynthesis
MLTDLLLSFTVNSKLENEIVVGLDKDDPDLEEYLSIGSRFDNVVFDIAERNFNLHTRINSMVSKLTGSYILVLNDDCLISTYGWDEYSKGILDSFGDIVYGRTYDNSIDRVNNKYAAFPIMSRKAVDKLGFIMDETFGNHGCDVIMYRIFEYVGAVVDLPGVEIDHVLHNSHNALLERQKDKTAVEMINRTFSKHFSLESLFNMDISEKAKRLTQ